MHEITLGVDLSDLTARMAVVDGAGQVLSRAEAPPGAGHSAAAVRDAARRAISGARAKVAAIAVALPAAGEELPADVAAALGEAGAKEPAIVTLPAGTAAAMAEQWCGAARGLQQVITFAIAEHVTAGVLINGEPWRGAHGLASSVGWLALNPVEREDYRRLGGLEAEVSSSGIVRRIVWRIKSGDDSIVVERNGGDLTRITTDQVFQGARGGDGVCISVIRDTAKYIGMAVSNLAAILDPEAIVLGGMIARSGDMLLESIRLDCSRRLRPVQAERLRIVLSPLGADAVAIGAARLATHTP